MMPYDYINKDFCQVKNINNNFDWFIINCLYLPINTNKT